MTCTLGNGLHCTISDYASQGSMGLWFSIRDAVPFAFPGLLAVIFFVLFAGNYFVIASRTGRAKILIALLSSSVVTMVLSMMLSLAQLVTYKTTIFYGLFTIVIFILFLVSDNN